MSNALLPTHEISTRHGPVGFVTTHPEALQFPRELSDREPETIAWIDGFAAPCSFWDIGANVGTYSLYAALRPGISVVAFEPAAASYAALCRNIEANRRSDLIKALCIALSDRTELGNLNMSATDAGNSFNLFESGEDCFGRSLAIQFRQSTIGFSIDDFRRFFDLPSPNYLKIDVDGTEERILDGAAATLAASTLRSILIEIEEADTARNNRIRERLERAGFVLTGRGVSQGGVSNGIFIRQTASSA